MITKGIVTFSWNNPNRRNFNPPTKKQISRSNENILNITIGFFIKNKFAYDYWGASNHLTIKYLLDKKNLEEVILAKELENSLLIDNNQIKIIEKKAKCLIALNLRSEANLFIEKFLKKFPNNYLLNILYAKNLISIN